jgi:DNA invertase Pin-like site-specific DNA recombinase
MIVGYARVSTDGQTLDARHATLTAAGAESVFAEKISGAVSNRKALAKAVAPLGPGDVLLVTGLGRLARSTRDRLNVLDAVGKARAGFRSLADAWAQNRSSRKGAIVNTPALSGHGGALHLFGGQRQNRGPTGAP